MNNKLQYYIDLVLVLTLKELKVRYKNNVLGYVWSVLHPLAFAFVFFVAFKVVMRIQMENYTLFLIAGLFPWQWFSNSVNFSTGVLIGNSSIIKKIDFPREVIPMVTVLNDAIHFLLAFPVIIVFMLIYHTLPSVSWIYGIPVLFILQFFLSYGLCLVFSAVNLFFRDMERLVSIFTTMLFYFTPVIFPETMIPERYRGIINLNPLAPLMINWRNLILTGTIEIKTLIPCLLYSVLFFTAGYILFKKLSYRFAEVL